MSQDAISRMKKWILLVCIVLHFFMSSPAMVDTSDMSLSFVAFNSIADLTHSKTQCRNLSLACVSCSPTSSQCASSKERSVGWAFWSNNVCASHPLSSLTSSGAGRQRNVGWSKSVTSSLPWTTSLWWTWATNVRSRPWRMCRPRATPSSSSADLRASPLTWRPRWAATGNPKQFASPGPLSPLRAGRVNDVRLSAPTWPKSSGP